MSNADNVVTALFNQITEYFDGPDWQGGPVTVLLNEALPADIPPGGLCIIRDGDPGQPDISIGQVTYFYSHSIPIEAYVEEADQSARDALFKDLLAGIGAAIDADRSLGGLAAGCQYNMPASQLQHVDGGADIKHGVITPVVDYETTSAI